MRIILVFSIIAFLLLIAIQFILTEKISAGENKKTEPCLLSCQEVTEFKTSN